MISMFSHDNNFKFVKCTKRATEIEKEENLYKQILLYHSNESMYSGINETYNTLKVKIYCPKFKDHIQLIINNCEKCQRVKYDRKPIRLMFKLTETPTDKNETIHVDIFHFKKQSFFTVIDKLTKFAAAYNITDRNWRAKKAIIIEHFAKYGKPKQIIMGNEFCAEQLIQFLNA